MHPKPLLLSFAFVLVSCSPCQRDCEQLKAQLVRDFGVLPSSIDCQSAHWREADTCEKCQTLLERDFGVQLITCEETAKPR
jgi:hypothetical protein